MTNKSLKEKARQLRNTVVDMAVKAKTGHVTSAFSQMELLVALYLKPYMRFDPQNLEWEDRDRLILSKGQGAIGLFPVLAEAGFFPKEKLVNFCGVDSLLGVHCEWHTPGVETISGSLGHGLPIATGMCQAARLNNKNHLVICIVGDAELYEGSNWEALLFANSKKYNNLVIVVDRNRQGAIGATDEDCGCNKDGPHLEELDKKFEAFGLDVESINGHSFEELGGVFENIRETMSNREGPLVIISNTSKGKGSDVFEDKHLWHYRVPQGEELTKVRQDISQVLND